MLKQNEINRLWGNSVLHFDFSSGKRLVIIVYWDPERPHGELRNALYTNRQ